MTNTLHRSPSFQFYPDDFISGTAYMTQAEIGAYVLLLCYQWNKGSIPTACDPHKIEVLARGDVSDNVLEKFPNGKNERMEIERRKQKENSERRSKSGTYAANTRWKRVVDDDAIRINSHCDGIAANMRVDASPTPTPTPTPTPINISTPQPPQWGDAPIKKDKKTESFNARKALIDHGVNEETVDAFIKLRNKRDGVITMRVLNSILKQAEIVKLTMEEALDYCIEANWQSFKSAWYLKREGVETKLGAKAAIPDKPSKTLIQGNIAIKFREWAREHYPKAVKCEFWDDVPARISVAYSDFRKGLSGWREKVELQKQDDERMGK